MNIDLWSGTLADLEPHYKQYAALLTAAEQERMRQYRCSKRGKEFALIRGWMRTVLAQYTGEAPARLPISYEAKGKPVLAKEQRKALKARLEFNLSHSGNQFMLAVTIGSKLGLDIERIRTIDEMDTMAHMLFSAVDFDDFHQTKDERVKQLRFFELWTQWEARYKWFGSEQSHYPDRAQLYCRTWEFTSGYIASLITERKNDTLSLIPWNGAKGTWLCKV